MRIRKKIILFALLLNFLLGISIYSNEFEPKESDLLPVSQEMGENLTIIQYYDNNEKWQEKHYKNNVLDGEQITWDKNGKIIYKTVFKNGTGTDKMYGFYGDLLGETKYSGGSVIKETDYYKNGKKAFEKNYKNDILDGDFIIWNKDGEIIYNTVFKNGTGTERNLYQDEQNFYDENSYSEYQLKNGVENGTHKEVKNGKLTVLEYYKDRELHGTATEYYENGQKSFERTFTEDVLDGKFTVWDKAGNVIYTTVFDMGTGIYKSYNEDGNIMEEREMKNRSYDGIQKTYYEENSQLMSFIPYKENTENGQVVFYYPNGVKSRELNYKMGILNGKYIAWDENGKKLYETNFVNGKGIMKLYNENGEMILETKYGDGGEILSEQSDSYTTEYENDMLNGKYTIYFREHDKIKQYEATYKDGALSGNFKAWNINGDLFYETEFINGSGIMKYYEEPELLRVIKYENGEEVKHGLYIDKRFKLLFPK